MNLQPLPTSCSKEEEITLLSKITRLFPAGTYTADLFSERFLAWHAGQLRNDFPPDVIMTFDHYAARTSEAETKERKAEERLTQANRLHDSTCNHYESELEKARKTEEELRTVIAKQRDERLELYTTLNKTAHELGIAHTNESRLREEITNLKARLFDLMQPA